MNSKAPSGKITVIIIPIPRAMAATPSQRQRHGLMGAPPFCLVFQYIQLRLAVSRAVRYQKFPDLIPDLQRAKAENVLLLAALNQPEFFF